jgi:hypothetical protein
MGKTTPCTNFERKRKRGIEENLILKVEVFGGFT